MFIRVNSKCAHLVRPPLRPDGEGLPAEKDAWRPLHAPPSFDALMFAVIDHWHVRLTDTCRYRTAATATPRRAASRQAPGIRVRAGSRAAHEQHRDERPHRLRRTWVGAGCIGCVVQSRTSDDSECVRPAVRGGEFVSMPHVPMLTLNNARQGFFEREELDAILEKLPTYLHAPLTFAFVTGWRLKSEVLPLTVDRVDLQAGVVRLDAGTTKNNEGRSFYLTNELRDVLKAQLISIEDLQQKDTICPHVFHRPDGSRIKDFRKTWAKACKAAGYPGKLFHDFRRSAVRTLERSGVPRSTAMAMVGHKTESIYRRYAIVDETMRREAADEVGRLERAAERKGRC
jgi:hypothetical protein